LFYWEELSSLMARGRWTGSTIFDFMTQTFDCPEIWGLKYRRKPVSVIRPTPTILTATTAEWFWKQARQEDFYGGFANRFAFLAGAKKPPLPQPSEPMPHELENIREKLTSLSQLEPCVARLSPDASELWESFYIDWESTNRATLFATAVKRIPAYVIKLAMIYAADEGTLPLITQEQLQAAIAVGKYAESCTMHLLDLQAKNASPMAELEERFIRFLKSHPGVEVRYMQQTLSKYTGGAEDFNRVLKNLIVADRIEIEIKGEKRRKAFLTE
jgi:hypothetical protein